MNNGATGPDGCIYFAPCSAKTVLCINPVTEEVSTITIDGMQPSSNMFFGCVCHHDGYIYALPACAAADLTQH